MPRGGVGARMSFRFHFIGMPHTATSPEWCHCAYTAKVYKAIRMFSRRGHTCIDYSNEGSTADCERVQIFSEAERASYFGPHEKQRLYHIVWDPAQPYWVEYNRRVVEALRPRVKKGDFLMTLSGNCQVGPIGDAFPGSYSGIQIGPAMVEWGIGYYGVQSRYRVFESQTHMEWVMGSICHKTEDNDATAIPNFFDLDEFVVHDIPDDIKAYQAVGPYYLFIGRVIQDKGFDIAAAVTADIGARLLIAGQGDPGNLGDHVTFFGHANVQERAALMTGAVATICPTRFREPFGGTAVETQLCGTPAITTDHGAFTQTVIDGFTGWRCASHREFVEAALKAQHVRGVWRQEIKADAESKYSLEAIAPKYERYFQRLMDRWNQGWYQKEPFQLPPEEPTCPKSSPATSTKSSGKKRRKR
jgi:glycosyltransferase involved in cell wall biosynthesis